MVVESTGEPNLVWVDRLTGRLDHARNSGGAWAVATVHPGGASLSVIGRCPRGDRRHCLPRVRELEIRRRRGRRLGRRNRRRDRRRGQVRFPGNRSRGRPSHRLLRFRERRPEVRPRVGRRVAVGDRRRRQRCRTIGIARPPWRLPIDRPFRRDRTRHPPDDIRRRRMDNGSRRRRRRMDVRRGPRCRRRRQPSRGVRGGIRHRLRSPRRNRMARGARRLVAERKSAWPWIARAASTPPIPAVSATSSSSSATPSATRADGQPRRWQPHPGSCRHRSPSTPPIRPTWRTTTGTSPSSTTPSCQPSGWADNVAAGFAADDPSLRIDDSGCAHVAFHDGYAESLGYAALRSGRLAVRDRRRFGGRGMVPVARPRPARGAAHRLLRRHGGRSQVRADVRTRPRRDATPHRTASASREPFRDRAPSSFETSATPS